MPESAEIRIRATPRARVERIEVEGDLVRVWVNAPPVDGEANAAICRLLAKRLGLPKSAVEIVRGSSGREKRARVDGLSLTEAIRRLNA